MLRVKSWLRNVIVFFTFALIVMFVMISTALFLWQSTDEGHLPAKTAVVLHAINSNLVSLDINIRPPRIVTGSGSSTPLLKEDIFIPISGDVQLPIRIYRPQGEGPFPIVFYFHGGAFMEGFGNIETHDNIIRSIANRTKSIVVAPSYRLAPDYIFPTAVEDSYEAILWTVEHADTINGDPENLSVMGDSAGGNIATVMTLMARDRNGPEFQAQVLLYPLTTFLDVTLESREQYDSGYFLLSRSVMYRARDTYTPEEFMWSHPYSSPLQAENLTELPPTLILTAEFDPLRDEGEAYAKRLAEEGINVRATRYSGVMHGFISFYEVMQMGRYGLQESSSFLRQAQEGSLPEQTEYALATRPAPEGLDQIRDQSEAFAIAAYLIGRSSFNFLLE